MNLTDDYIKALKKAYRTSTEENYFSLLQGIVCRLDLPNEHEKLFRKNSRSLNDFKEQCKSIVVDWQNTSRASTSA